jgi:4a-hydroxytetrahydrobiopterin dehydratase
MTTDGISASDFHATDGTGEWRILGDGATTFFRTTSMTESAGLVGALAGLDEPGAPPGLDIDVRADGVTVRLYTYTDDYFGMSRRDVERARTISRMARDRGLSGDWTAVEAIGPIVIGAVDIARVMPFWAAILGYVVRADSPDEDLIDPRWRGPGLWFEEVDAPAAGRPRMHVACWVPFEQAEARVQAALAAGGAIVYDGQAPSWWTLADPEGNEADIATIKGRD